MESTNTGAMVGLLALVVAGCGRGEAPEPIPADLAQAPGAQSPAEPSPTVGDASTFAYNPIGKRDPYRPFFPTKPPGPDACSHDPLQCFAVEQLELTGVVWGVRPRALLEDPSGGSHVVELGTYVGNRWGRITHIESGAVVVTEEYLSGDDELVVHPIRLNLDPLG
jgi:type IV pilus assembly protein PilP